VGRLLEAARTDRLGAYLTVALALGLRPGEARALRWDDVDLDGPHPNVRVRSAFRRAAGGEGLAEPKARSKPTVPLPEECTSMLRDHKRGQQKERLAAGEDWQEGGFVFTTTSGCPLSESTVSRWFTRLRSDVGIEHGRLYDCRHTAASLLLAQGVDPLGHHGRAGHSTFRLPMDTYAHVLPATLREAALAMDAALAGASRAAGLRRENGDTREWRSGSQGEVARHRTLKPAANLADRGTSILCQRRNLSIVPPGTSIWRLSVANESADWRPAATTPWPTLSAVGLRAWEYDRDCR
jgi:hypothetical protein